MHSNGPIQILFCAAHPDLTVVWPRCWKTTACKFNRACCCKTNCARLYQRWTFKVRVLRTTLCELWSEDKAGSADKKGFDSILCRLSVVGGLMAENPQEFAEVFGEESNAGLYDRFIFGLAPKWKYTIPSFRSENRMPYPGTPEVPEYVYDMAHAWRDMIENGRERLAEIALRVALVTTGMNHDKTITRECMQAALNFMTWQEAIREHFRPSRAEPTIEAKVTEVIERAVSSMVDGEGRPKWVSWRRVYRIAICHATVGWS